MTTVNDRQRPSTKNDDRHQKEKEKEKEKYINDGDDARACAYTDAEIRKHQEELASVENAAKAYGLPVNIGNLQTAEGLIGVYGVDWVLQAIELAGNGKEQTWRYVTGILEKAKADGGFTRKARKPARTVAAQDYAQRDYSGVKAEMPDWMIAGMKELENAEV